MSYDSRQIEHIMTTIMACRSLVKYNMALEGEPRGDLLRDIDDALDILRTCMIAGPVSEQKPPEVKAATPPINTAPIAAQREIHKENTQEKQALHELYRMYHAYLENQTTNVEVFVTRFNEIMATINEVQQLATPPVAVYEVYAPNRPIEGALERLRTFISELYYIFMEFMRVLSETLQRNNVHLDTEELSSMQRARDTGRLSYVSSETRKDLAQLLSVYEVHQKLQDRRGLLSHRISSATAFVEFLKESFGSAGGASQRREEIVRHLDDMSRLLHDVASLLGEYEKAAFLLLSGQ